MAGPPASPMVRLATAWRSCGAQRAGLELCVSPHPFQLADAIAASLNAAAGLPVVSLKYGGDAYGMLRPDKLVVHLASADVVPVLANRLLRVLGGCPVQGVPYTAGARGDGLISWGCDPPAGSPAPSSARGWRTWVTCLSRRDWRAHARPGSSLVKSRWTGSRLPAWIRTHGPQRPICGQGKTLYDGLTADEHAGFIRATGRCFWCFHFQSCRQMYKRKPVRFRQFVVDAPQCARGFNGRRSERGRAH